MGALTPNYHTYSDPFYDWFNDPSSNSRFTGVGFQNSGPGQVMINSNGPNNVHINTGLPTYTRLNHPEQYYNSVPSGGGVNHRCGSSGLSALVFRRP